MKRLAVTITVLGVLALVASIVPMGGAALVSMWNATGTDQAVMMVTALVVATAAGALGLVRPPLRPWHLAIALACFAFAVTKLRIWEVVPRFFDEAAALQLLLAIAVVGVAVTMFGFVRPRTLDA